MLKRLIPVLLCFYIATSFAQTGEAEKTYSGDTVRIHAISPKPFSLKFPDSVMTSNHIISGLNHKETINYKNIVDHPWPETFQELRLLFMKVEIEDPIANLDLHLPSMKDLAALARTPGIPGQIGLYSGPGPFSLLYDQFSKEARSKRLYAGLVRKDKAGERYNKALVSRITGITNEDQLKQFMYFCALQIKFILESTDYELYAAILNCYVDFCKAGLHNDDPGE